MAFRPSWAPLEPELPPPAARPSAPGEAASASLGREDEPRDLQEPLRLPVRGARRRASLLAGASVLSFLGLLYWGISSTTHPAAPVHVLQNSQRGLHGNAVERPASEPATTDIAAPGATATDLSALRARPELLEPSRARLADPDSPPAAPAAPEAAPAESDMDGTERLQLAEAAPGSAEAPAVPAAVESATAAPSTDQPAAAVEARPASAPGPSAASSAIPSAQHPQSTASAPLPAPAAEAPAAIPSAQHAESKASAPSPAPSALPVPPAPAPPVPVVAAPLTAAAKPGAAQREPIATAARSPVELAPQRKRMPLLSVRALPEGARLFLDGQRLPNPFDMRLPEGGKHKLEARYEGYESSTQNVRIEADAKLTITLRRTPTEPQLQVRPLGQQPAQHPQGAGFVTSNPY